MLLIPALGVHRGQGNLLGAIQRAFPREPRALVSGRRGVRLRGAQPFIPVGVDARRHAGMLSKQRGIHPRLGVPEDVAVVIVGRQARWRDAPVGAGTGAGPQVELTGVDFGGKCLIAQHVDAASPQRAPGGGVLGDGAGEPGRGRGLRLLAGRGRRGGGGGTGDDPHVLGDRIAMAAADTELDALAHRLSGAAAPRRVRHLPRIRAKDDLARQPGDEPGALGPDSLPVPVRRGVPADRHPGGQRRRGAIHQVGDIRLPAPVRDQVQPDDGRARPGPVGKYRIAQIGDVTIGRRPGRRRGDDAVPQVELLPPSGHLARGKGKVLAPIGVDQGRPGRQVGPLLHLAGRLSVEPRQGGIDRDRPGRISLASRWHPDPDVPVASEGRRIVAAGAVGGQHVQAGRVTVSRAGLPRSQRRGAGRCHAAALRQDRDHRDRGEPDEPAGQRTR